MKNLKTFFKEKKETFKVAGSVVGSISIIALSSCSISDIKNSNSSIESTTISSISITDIPTTSNETNITPAKTEITKNITTIETTNNMTTIETTNNMTTIETTMTPAPVSTNIPTTENPIESTTKIVTTKEPIKTTIVTTTKKQTTIKEEEPIEYETRTDEIIGYYNSVELNNTTKLTKQNVNNYEDFLSVANNINSGSIIFYQVYYNLDTNKREKTWTGAFLENILFLAFINDEYIDNKTIKNILKPYSHDELSYMTNNVLIVFNRNLYENIYYDFSSITIDKEICDLLTKIQNAYKINDYKTVEKLCNENYKKYNAFIDLMLLIYEYNMPEIKDYITDENSFELSLQVIDKTGIYERAHQ